MLFAVTYAGKDLILVALIAALVAFCLGWLLRKDTAVEAYQRGVMETVGRLKTLNHAPGGMIDQFAKFLTNIGIKDLSGVYQATKAFGDKFDEPEEFMRLLRVDFKAQFPDIFDKEDIGPWLLEQVDQWRATQVAKAATAAEAAGYVLPEAAPSK